MMRFGKKILMLSACIGTAAAVCGQAVAAAPAAVSALTAQQQVQGIEEVTGVAESFGDGEKIAYAVLAYPKEIDASALSPEDFAVTGRSIVSAATTDRVGGAAGRPGRYVVLRLAQENTAFDGDLSTRAPRADAGGEKAQAPAGDAPMVADRQLPDLSLQVAQTGFVRAADGTLYAPRLQPVASTGTVAPVLDAFTQHVYTDPETGYQMPYNLYLPKDYDPAKKYPLLFFVTDASSNIDEVTTPLFQGNGATVWAEPAEQAKHPCIVLAPQYTRHLVDTLGMMTTDENCWTPGLALVTHLLFDVIRQYPVDTSRIYGTGQSQGGMTNIAISDAYPDLFAAQLLVACQWNVDEMAAMKDKNLWIVVCEGDTKAYPGMNAATALWEKLGAKVARNQELWDSKADASVLNAEVRQMAQSDARIHYSVFAGGNHMYTWSFAYGIEALRDWLFSQRK